MKVLLKSSAILAAGLALALFVAAAMLAFEDPLVGLVQPVAPPTVISDTAESRDDRKVRRVRLADPAVGDIGLFVSLPAEPGRKRLPVLLLIGGLGTGEENATAVADPGDNALVGYDWPLPLKIPGFLEVLPRVPSLRSRLLRVPGQVAAAIAWLSDQEWADPERVSLAGFSLGALVAPAAQRLVEAKGLRLSASVLAYGGAGLGELLGRHPRVRESWARAPIAIAADLLLRPLEPAFHLPRLIPSDVSHYPITVCFRHPRESGGPERLDSRLRGNDGKKLGKGDES